MRWIAAFGLPIGLVALVVALMAISPKAEDRSHRSTFSVETPERLDPAEVPPRQWIRLKNRYGRAEFVEDPELVLRVEDAARASGARAIDVTVIDFGPSKLRVPVTTLQADSHHDEYMRVGLREFLRSYPNRSHAWLVQLVGSKGGQQWIGGAGTGPKKGTRWRLREMWWDLRGCTPFERWTREQPLTLWTEPPPPCTDDDLSKLREGASAVPADRPTHWAKNGLGPSPVLAR